MRVTCASCGKRTLPDDTVCECDLTPDKIKNMDEEKTYKIELEGEGSDFFFLADQLLWLLRNREDLSQEAWLVIHVLWEQINKANKESLI